MSATDEDYLRLRAIISREAAQRSDQPHERLMYQALCGHYEELADEEQARAERQWHLQPHQAFLPR